MPSKAPLANLEPPTACCKNPLEVSAVLPTAPKPAPIAMLVANSLGDSDLAIKLDCSICLLVVGKNPFPAVKAPISA